MLCYLDSVGLEVILIRKGEGALRDGIFFKE